MSAISLRNSQNKLYGGNGGPPILPHGDDLELIKERRRVKKRRKLSQKESQNTKTSPSPGSFSQPASCSAVPTEASAPVAPTTVNPALNQALEQRFPESDIPAGFPPELVFRALAAYATIRTLSLKLRLSPFTPVVFLRALNLPVPTRLLGHVHVALLRILLPHLGQHYHWGAAVPHTNHGASQLKRFPWLPNTKKRKLDGLRWPLKAGDNLEFLDPFTWPIFFDDYAHLMADQLWWSSKGPPFDELNRNVDDPKDNPNVWKNLDVSTVPSDWMDPDEDWRERMNPRVSSISVLYLNGQGEADEGSDADEEIFLSREEDEDFDLAAAVEEEIDEEQASRKKRKRGRPRKYDSSAPKPAPASAQVTAATTGKPAPKHQSHPNVNTQSNVLMQTGPPNPQPATPDRQVIPTNPFPLVSSPSSRVLEVSFPPPWPGTNQTVASHRPVYTMPMAATSSEHMRMAAAVQQQTALMACMSSRPALAASSFSDNSSNIKNNMVRPGSAAALRMQQQMRSQPNSSTVAGMLAVPNPPHPKPKVQNRMAQRFLPTSTVPVASRPAHGFIKIKKPVDPKLEAAADVIDKYMFGFEPKNEATMDEMSTAGTGRDKVQYSVDFGANKGSVPENDEFASKVDNDSRAKDENAEAEAPYVWAHFNALKELREGKAYHQLSVERKLDILEYLIDQALTLDVIADEMTFRYNSKEQYDHPYGDLPKQEEFDELENDDQCAVCLGDGDLLCCDGCPSSFHQQCIDLPLYETLPEGKWYCPECTLVDPAKFGPLREGPKSSVDWFHLRDVCRSQEHLLSLANVANGRGPTQAMSEETEYMVIRGYVFQRPGSHTLPFKPSESPNAPKCLSKTDLATFLMKVGAEDRNRWPIAQIPSNDTGTAAYLTAASTYDPNSLSNKYRQVPPLNAPKRLNFAVLKTVEDVCCRLPLGYVSDCLTKSMQCDARIIQRQASANRPFCEIEIAKNYARELHNRLLKSLLFRVSCHYWAADSFFPELAKAKSIKDVSRLLVSLVDAAHPRMFEQEWFESPSHKPSVKTESRKKSTMVMLCEDSTPELERTRRSWQCMQPGNIPCSLSKRLVKPSEWIREVRPDLAHTPAQKNKRKRDNQHVRQPANSRGMVDYLGSPSKAKATEKAEEEEEEEGHHLRRTRHEKNAEQTEARRESLAHVQKHIDKEQEKLISFVLGVPSELWIREPNWPVAGRRLFEPIGELPKAQVRRLARRAGSVRAPFVMYSQAFEVGQASCYHIWRKQMLGCTNFEDLLLGMRTITTFLDANAIKQGTTAARKFSKNAAAKSDIYCACTDLSCGEESYLVIDKDGSTGTWVSSHTVDIKPLISFQSKRIGRLEAKRRAQLLKKSAPKVRPKVTPPPRKPSLPSSKNISGLPGQVDYILHNHNQKVLRLFWIHPNSMGTTFLQSRKNLRNETVATLSNALRHLGVSFDASTGYPILAKSEKTYLESLRDQYPAILRKLPILYPEMEASTTTTTNTPPTPSSHHKTTPGTASTTQPIIKQRPASASHSGKRREYRCGKCGQTGHNAKKCPFAPTSAKPAGWVQPSSVNFAISSSPHNHTGSAPSQPPAAKQGQTELANPSSFGSSDVAAPSVPNDRSQKRPRIDPPPRNSMDASIGNAPNGLPDIIDPEVWRMYLASQGNRSSQLKTLSEAISNDASQQVSSLPTQSGMAQGMSSAAPGMQHLRQESSQTAQRIRAYPLLPQQQHQQSMLSELSQQHSFQPNQHGRHIPPNASQSIAERHNPSGNPYQHYRGIQAVHDSHAVNAAQMAPMPNAHSSPAQLSQQGGTPSQHRGRAAQINHLLSSQGGNPSASQINQLMNGSAYNANLYNKMMSRMNRAGNFPSRPRRTNHSTQQTYGSVPFNSMPNQYQQPTPGHPPVPVQNPRNDIPPHLLEGLEPTPLPGLPQQPNRGTAAMSSQRASHGGPRSSAKTPGHENTLMSNQDFFSPTPINPNHELNQRAHHQQGQPPMNPNPYPYQRQPQRPPQANNPSFQGYGRQGGHFYHHG